MTDGSDRMAALVSENTRYRRALREIAQLDSGGPHADALDAALETVSTLARARAIATTALEDI